MKKIKIITVAISLCMAASLFAGCNSQAGESAAITRIEGGQTKIAVENGGNDKSSASALKFTYKGFDIVPGSDIGPVIESIGEPPEKSDPHAICATQGEAVEYFYDGFEIDTHIEPDESSEIIVTIKILDTLIDCGGVHLGDKLEKVKQIYGAPTSEDDFGLDYISGNTRLRFSSDGTDSITAIEFNWSY